MYYYFCFIVIIVSVLLVQIVLLNVQNIANNFPFFLLTYSIFRPYAIPNSISIQVCENSNQYKIIPMASNQGGSSVFENLITEFKLILQESSPGKVLHNILWGENLFHVMRNLLNIQARINPGQYTTVNGEVRKGWGSKLTFVKELFKITLF